MPNKVSEIRPEDVASYIHLDDATMVELDLIQTQIKIAKDYIRNFTGQPDLDKYSEFVIVVFVLVQDMYDHRSLYVDKSNVNKVVESILNMHKGNLL